MIKLYYTFSNPDSIKFIKKSLFLFSGKNDFVIKWTKNGKPYTDENIYFSLSHTDGLTVCAVSDGEIGIDAEKIRATVPNSANKRWARSFVFCLGNALKSKC